MPVVDYGRTLGYSITGGYVYRGARVPQLAGAYIFGDYGSGNIFLLRYDGGRLTADTVLLRNDALNISSFGVDEKNELYVLGYNTGKVLRLTGQAEPTSVTKTEVPLSVRAGPGLTKSVQSIDRYQIHCRRSRRSGSGVRDSGPVR